MGQGSEAEQWRKACRTCHQGQGSRARLLAQATPSAMVGRRLGRPLQQGAQAELGWLGLARGQAGQLAG